jgi:hypothetical protein
MHEVRVQPTPPVAVRLLVAVCLWCVRIAAGLPNGALALVAVVLDVALIGVHTWINEPLSSKMGQSFGSRANVSGFLLVPIAIAAYYVFRDAWACFSHG